MMWYKQPGDDCTWIMPVPGGAVIRVDVREPLFDNTGAPVGYSCSTHSTFVPFPPACEPAARAQWDNWIRRLG